MVASGVWIRRGRVEVGVRVVVIRVGGGKGSKEGKNKIYICLANKRGGKVQLEYLYLKMVRNKYEF